ncbi:MAG: hypothetical protein J6T10_06665 [Methanobrevibacter sp.]|nr:hypothetical protein [Methanobrevibacter sp.]
MSQIRPKDFKNLIESYKEHFVLNTNERDSWCLYLNTQKYGVEGKSVQLMSYTPANGNVDYADLYYGIHNDTFKYSSFYRNVTTKDFKVIEDHLIRLIAFLNMTVQMKDVYSKELKEELSKKKILEIEEDFV